jgi:hypothetical protein
VAKRTKSQQIGDTGEHLVAKLVSEMGHIWRRNPADYGIDGQIEVVDRDMHPTGRTISVQVKTTLAERVPGEDDNHFTYTCSARELDYWLGASEPVLLVFVRLDQQRAWFKRLDTWFSEPKRRKTRVVVFEKVDDLLGPGAEHQIAAAATPAEDPLPLVRSSETLTTNLLVVEQFAPMIHWAEAAVSDRREAWASMSEHGEFESGFLLSGGKVYSLIPLTGALKPLCRSGPKCFPTAEWEESEDPDTRRRFVQLLNFTLRAMHYRELKQHPDKHYLFHLASPGPRPRKVKFRKGAGRTVFEVYRDKENKITYCRHYAAFLNFKEFDGQWYLEINPTYHFTRDGEQESLYAAEKLSKMKRMERNAAVKGLLNHWAHFLAEGHRENLFDVGDERIVFGQLAMVTVDASIDERTWIVPKENEAPDVPLFDESEEAS